MPHSFAWPLRWSRRLSDLFFGQRQRVGFRQRLCLRLRKKWNSKQPKAVEQADNGGRFPVTAQTNNQSAREQWRDRRDQTRRIENKTSGRRAHACRKQFRQPYRG